jgi:RNA 2',3'-cyclic 3'-phosphodiesterase
VVEGVGRLFVAVPLPPEIRAALADQLRDLTLPGKPVPIGNWHLTLRFLGAADEVRYDRVRAEVDQALDRSAFAVALESLGAFPNPRRATVLWVGIAAGRDRLTDLAGVVEDAAVAAGFEPEDRPYRPHLTISRIRPDTDVRAVLEHPVGPLRFTVDHLALYRSHLGGAAARYEVLETFPLR